MNILPDMLAVEPPSPSPLAPLAPLGPPAPLDTHLDHLLAPSSPPDPLGPLPLAGAEAGRRSTSVSIHARDGRTRTVRYLLFLISHSHESNFHAD